MSDYDEMTLEEKLALKRKQRAEKDRAAADVAAARELEGLELREAYEDSLGEMGKTWFLANTSAGWFVLRIGLDSDKLRWKQWQVAVDKANNTNRPIELSDTVAFVKPAIVYPSEERVKEVYAIYPGLYSSLSGPLTSLFTGKTRVQAGKV